MIALSDIQNIAYQREYLLVKSLPLELSLYGAIGISILNIICNYDSDMLFRYKFYRTLESSFEISEKSETNCHELMKYLKVINNNDFLSDLKRDILMHSLIYGIISLINYLSSEDKITDQLLLLSREFDLYIELHDKKSTITYGNKNPKEITILKQNNHYHSLLIKNDLVLDCYRIVSNLSNLNQKSKELLERIQKSSNI